MLSYIVDLYKRPLAETVEEASRVFMRPERSLTSSSKCREASLPATLVVVADLYSRQVISEIDRWTAMYVSACTKHNYAPVPYSH
jgi:hypothetical protein